jgi:hypothetical protein
VGEEFLNRMPRTYYGMCIIVFRGGVLYLPYPFRGDGIGGSARIGEIALARRHENCAAGATLDPRRFSSIDEDERYRLSGVGAARLVGEGTPCVLDDLDCALHATTGASEGDFISMIGSHSRPMALGQANYSDLTQPWRDLRSL